MRRVLVFCVAILISICNANAVMDLTGITNAGGWVQRTNLATYTVGQDGLSLFYRGQDTGMKLQNASTVGGKIRVTDPAIPPRTRGRVTPPNPQPNPTPNPQPNPTPGPAVTPRVNVLGAVAGMAGMVMSMDGLVAANQSDIKKKTWEDLGASAASGAGIMATGAMVLNAIPGVGQVSWVAASAVGAVGGALTTGKKIFAETDCELDYVRTYNGEPIYACCNVSKLTNIKAFYADIGDDMWDEFPYVRTCMQGGSKVAASSWFEQRFKDDAWGPRTEALCSGVPMPIDMTNVVPVGIDMNQSGRDLCWTWTCAGNFVVDEAQAKCVPYVEPQPEQEVETPVMCFIDGDEDDIENWANIGDRLTCLAEKVAAGAEDAYMECLESGEWSQCKIICGADKHLVDGKCVPKTSDAQPNDKPDVIVIVPQKKCETPECKACKQLVEKGEAKWEDEVCVCKNGLDFVMSRDNKSAVCVSLDAAIGNIDKAAKNLDDIIGGLKLTVWKDAQGNFNTARLASDSIAGVVLGTTGALITSKLVKKKQVEDGFEDIQCVIGGQKVADWGDEFNVGMQ